MEMGNDMHYELYKELGAHPVEKDGQAGVHFAVWAPNAVSVSVVGDFNDWNRFVNWMQKDDNTGVYTTFVTEARVGDRYKFCIKTRQGEYLFKADPFASAAEIRPRNASRVADIHHLRWTDDEWLRMRREWNHRESPVSVYEVHIGSWKRHPNREGANAFYSYREFAHDVTAYVKDMGYTHIELMGIAEHPYDGSWGYQVTGYYAPTSRYGTPEDFAYMINYFHQNGIGVILDWVPAHFAKDEHGLAEFDGTALYEYADCVKGEHAQWGTKVFDYGKKEVKNFLISNALYWIEHFHIDGLRVDAVASMLYLDYGREYDEWIPNAQGGNQNLEAVEFLKQVNRVVKERNAGVMMIAEESTTWPKVTGELWDGGLGFDIKWNMGWMHDFIEYMKLDPYFRKGAHYHLTFGMTYAYNEEYMLVLSHDEVVHMKGSMLNKMSGDGQNRFANLKVGYAFMVGHVGKKLLFMGQDFAQEREWSEERELDWYLLARDSHKQVQNFVRDLLYLYRTNEALYECDGNPEGFQWINADDTERSIYSFLRHSKGQRNNLLFVCNFTPVERSDFRVGVPWKTGYKLILNSDEEKYGGCKKERQEFYWAEEEACDRLPYSISYDLPSYGVAVFEF